MTISNADFTDMSCPEGSGASILASGNKSALNISHSTFLRTSVDTGGSITLSDSNMTMTSSTCDSFTGSAISALESKIELRDVNI